MAEHYLEFREVGEIYVSISIIIKGITVLHCEDCIATGFPVIIAVDSRSGCHAINCVADCDCVLVIQERFPGMGWSQGGAMLYAGCAFRLSGTK